MRKAYIILLFNKQKDVLFIQFIEKEARLSRQKNNDINKKHRSLKNIDSQIYVILTILWSLLIVQNIMIKDNTLELLGVKFKIPYLKKMWFT